LDLKREQVISALKLPMDVFLGELIVSLIGRRAVYIENYQSILFYTDTRLKIQGKGCKLNILGKRLFIEYYTGDNMKVTGFIESIELEG
jgi:sporulation protein YqfC